MPKFSARFLGGITS